MKACWLTGIKRLCFPPGKRRGKCSTACSVTPLMKPSHASFAVAGGKSQAMGQLGCVCHPCPLWNWHDTLLTQPRQTAAHSLTGRRIKWSVRHTFLPEMTAEFWLNRCKAVPSPSVTAASGGTRGSVTIKRLGSSPPAGKFISFFCSFILHLSFKNTGFTKVLVFILKFISSGSSPECPELNKITHSVPL